MVKHFSELSRRVPILHDKASKRLVRKKKEPILKREAEWCSSFHNLLKCLRSVANWISGLCSVCFEKIYFANLLWLFPPAKKKENRLICFFSRNIDKFLSRSVSPALRHFSCQAAKQCVSFPLTRALFKSKVSAEWVLAERRRSGAEWGQILRSLRQKFIYQIWTKSYFLDSDSSIS